MRPSCPGLAVANYGLGNPTQSPIPKYIYLPTETRRVTTSFWNIGSSDEPMLGNVSHYLVQQKRRRLPSDPSPSIRVRIANAVLPSLLAMLEKNCSPEEAASTCIKFLHLSSLPEGWGKKQMPLCHAPSAGLVGPGSTQGPVDGETRENKKRASLPPACVGI